MPLIPLSRLFRRTPWTVSSLLLALAASPLFGQAIPTAADGFNPNVTGTVNALAVQPNGEIIMGGIFSAVQPTGAATATGANSLARVHVDGSLDTIYPLAPVGTIAPQVNVIALQPNGQIVVAGAFSTSSPNISNFARFNADGSLDTSFVVQLTGTFTASVTAIAIQPNGQIIIGGNFSSVQGTGSTTAILRSHIARLNANGSLDTTFNPDANAQIDSIYVVPSQFANAGQILIGGAFTTLNPGLLSTTVQSYNHIARLNSDGSIDSSFNPNLNNQVAAFAMQPDAKIVIVGAFTSLQPNGAATATPVAFIARLNPDGTQDIAFQAAASSAINSMVLQPNGQMVLGGPFTAIQFGGSSNNTRNFLARINADGTTDLNFAPNANSTVQALALQADGKVLVGGSFTQMHPLIAPSVTNRNGIARINLDGTVDADFDPNAYGGVGVVVAAPNGQYLIGGAFASVGGATETNLARLNADGSVDPTFDPAPNGSISAIAVQANGQILVGGNFSSIGGVGINNVARLNADGSVDTTFNPNPSGGVSALAVQPNGLILMGGNFPTIQLPASTTLFTAPGYLVRLNPDGSPDPSFIPNPSDAISCILLEPSDNAIIIGGQFTSLTPASTNTSTSSVYIARLNAKDGSVDTTFDNVPDNPVTCLALQPNGQILIGGAFDALVPNDLETETISPTGVITTNLIPRNRIYRLNADGTIDMTFNPNADGTVFSVTVTPSGQIWTSGLFKNIGGGAQPYIARLNATTGALDPTFAASVNGDVRVVLALSTNQVIAGGAFTTVTPPSGTPVIEYHVARFNADATGSLDTTFNTTAKMGGSFSSFALQPDGLIIVGGAFTNVAGVYATNIARLFADNTFDSTFGANADGPVNTITMNSDASTFYVGGSFAVLGGSPAANFGRANPDGSLDTTFTANTDGPVNTVVVQPNGLVVLGGVFLHVNGTARSRLARVNFGDGSLDPSFNPAFNGTVNALALATQASSGQTQILVGGSFTTISGVTVNGLGRLNADGSVDPTFNPNVNGTVNAIVVQSDGAVIVGGSFTTVGGVARSNLARLLANGTVDPSYNPGPNGAVNALVLQNNPNANVITGSGASPTGNSSSVVIGGAFTKVGGANYPHAARINFDGTIDATFNPSPDASVNALAVQQDGKIYLGGTFANVGGLIRNGMARLSTPSVTSESISIDTVASPTNPAITIGRRLTYTYGGPAPYLSQVLFQVSTDDGVTWTNVGSGIPTAGYNNPTWTLALTNSLPSGLFTIRALGVELTSQYGSGSQIPYVQEFYQIQPPLLASATALMGTASKPFYYEFAATNTPTSVTATGLPPGLTLNSTTGVISGTPTTAGLYPVAVTLTDAGGTSAVNLTFTVTVSTGTPAAARLVNLSSLATIGPPTAAALAATAATAALTGASAPTLPTTMITDGFVIAGPGSETVLLRGIGTGLSAMGIGTTVQTPQLTLYNQAGSPILTAGSWDGSAVMQQIFAQTGAFPLTIGSTDAAVVTTLPPGVYSLAVTSADGTTGSALAEIYAADLSPLLVPEYLGNLSANGTVATGSPLTGGFTISGTSPKTLLVRGVGPALGSFNVNDFIPTPVLTIYNTAGAVVAQNTGWSTQSAATVSAITAAAASVGAFPLPAGSADSALLVTLPPGVYSAQVTDAGSNYGVALFEVYSLGP